MRVYACRMQCDAYGLNYLFRLQCYSNCCNYNRPSAAPTTVPQTRATVPLGTHTHTTEAPTTHTHAPVTEPPHTHATDGPDTHTHAPVTQAPHTHAPGTLHPHTHASVTLPPHTHPAPVTQAPTTKAS